MNKVYTRHKKLFSNIFSLLVLQGANYILPLITLPYLVSTLGVKKFGIIAFSQAVIRYFNIFIDYGFNLSATREISINQTNIDTISKIFNSVMIIKVLLLIISFGILFILINLISKFQEIQLILYFTFLMLVGNVLFPIWYYQGIEKMKYITIINILAKLFFTISIFIFIKNESDYLYVPLINSIGFIFAGLIAFYIAKKEIKLSLPSLKYMKKIFIESTSLFISNASVSLFTSINILILGFFTNNHLVGIYSSIERLIMAIKGLFGVVYQALFPWLSKQDIDQIYIKIRYILPYVLAISLIISFILIYFARDILHLLYHKVEILEYTYLFQIFSFTIIFAAVSMLFNFLFLNAIKAYKIRMKIILVSGIFNFILSISLTYVFNINGTVASMFVTEVFLLILGIYYFNGDKNEKYYKTIN